MQGTVQNEGCDVASSNTLAVWHSMGAVHATGRGRLFWKEEGL